MKKILYLTIALLVISLKTYSQESQMESLQHIIKTVKEKYAKDSRTALFNIKIEEEANLIRLSGKTNVTAASRELQALIRKAGIELSYDVKILPDKDLGEKIWGIVNVSVVSIRSNPQHSAELATQALLGTVVKILEKDGGWYLVQTPDKYIAWADGDGIHLIDSIEKENWIAEKRIFYTKEYGFSYEKADENSQHITDLVCGNILKYIGTDNGFYRVIYPSGKKAYVKINEAKDFASMLRENKPSSQAIVETAKKFMGVPYLWGGTSAKLLDCSGFVKTVYFLNGIILARDASQQVKQGIPIDISKGYSKLEKGDLLFFGEKIEGKEKITHVGIYINDGDFIHESGEVKINSFNINKPYYNKRREKAFLQARRVLSSIGKNGIETIKQNKFYYGE